MTLNIGMYQAFPTSPAVISHVCVKLDGEIHLYEGNPQLPPEMEETYTVCFASNLDRISIKNGILKTEPTAIVIMK